jgi:hypothetical protein
MIFNRPKTYLGILGVSMVIGAIVECFVRFEHFGATYTIFTISPYLALLVILYLEYFEESEISQELWEILCAHDPGEIIGLVILLAMFLLVFIPFSYLCLKFPLLIYAIIGLLIISAFFEADDDIRVFVVRI